MRDRGAQTRSDINGNFIVNSVTAWLKTFEETSWFPRARRRQTTQLAEIGDVVSRW